MPRRGRSAVRTPPPPAGPQQYSAVDLARQPLGGARSAWFSATRRRTSRALPAGCAASQRPASSPNTLATPIRSARSGPSAGQPLAQHLGSEPRACFGAGAGVGDLALGEPAGLVADVDLQRRRARAWPRTPLRRTRSGPTSATSAALMSATTSGVR